MNASIALEVFGSPSIPSGLWRVLDRIKPGDNAAKVAAGKSTTAVNQANHRQRALGSLPSGNSKSRNTTRPRPPTHTQEFRACANRRVSYVSKSSKKAVQSLREMSCAKGCPPIGAASNSLRLHPPHDGCPVNLLLCIAIR